MLARGIERKDRTNLSEQYCRPAATCPRTLGTSMSYSTVAMIGLTATPAYPQGGRKVFVGGL